MVADRLAVNRLEVVRTKGEQRYPLIKNLMISVEVTASRSHNLPLI